MKQIYVFILVTTLTSCEYFNVKKTTPEAILNEELQTFNWNEVDVYPSFSACDSLETKDEKTACFTDVLTKHILRYLENDSIVVTQDVNETIYLQFQVSETGFLSLSDVKLDSLLVQEIPNLENLIHSSLDSLPKIYPAIKRGQQVKTEFELPIIIQAN
ncbi:hypothetical protein QLS71_008280 [Mariniflexile litorale]|uniref:TonB-like protein n=1 Tax=Mariniflexile litorale TaxID=3045158 RepID=A0AAU7EK35_9FLAO|nr:hypothetical protein [Mariniflexile sp. KMM 9835]MDQ8212770.1 hypothetical protein [Mariniflexile sp. KMM 9835]